MLLTKCHKFYLNFELYLALCLTQNKISVRVRHLKQYRRVR